MIEKEDFLEYIKAADEAVQRLKSPIGAIRLVEIRQVSSGKNSFVAITKWQTSLGQTIYTKR